MRELDAILARLKSGPAGTLNVYDSRPDSTTYPYVVVYAGAGIRDSDREGDVRVRRTFEWQTTTVGSSPAQCRAALARVADALEDWVPTIAGRDCSKVEHPVSRPMFKDDTLPDRVVYTAVDQWSVVSSPA